MRDVLVLGYHFPPIGGAGAQRTVQIARHLGAAGFRPLVVTGPGPRDYRWTPVDEELGRDLGRSAAIHRIPAAEPSPSRHWEGRLERWLGRKSSWERWWTAHAVSLGLEVGRTAEVIHASFGPYVSAEAALAIAAELDRPLVLDLEDPWALDEMLVYPTELHRRLALRRMRAVLGNADAIVMNTPEAARRVRRLPGLAGKPVVSIPNRFDSADFSGPPPPAHEGFRIVHTGSLHTDLGLRERAASRRRRLLGGSARHVDFLTRSLVFLVESLDGLLDERPQLASRIELHVAGVVTEADERVLKGKPYARLHGFMSHARTIALIRSAGLLFLPMHDVPPGRRVAITPHKTYEYLASGRPILAAVPDGDTRDLLAEAGSAFICRPSDTAHMRAVVAQVYDDAEAGRAPPAPDAKVVARYESRRLVSELAEVYRTLLAPARAGRGSGVTPAGGSGGALTRG